MTRLTHLDPTGKARMVDISHKKNSQRLARAKARVMMRPETLEAIEEGNIKKGDVFSVARLAGIMAAKKTADLIPLCHGLSVQDIQVDLEGNVLEKCVDIEASASLYGQTGVEMEVLSAVSVAALTIYDMCKALDRTLRITDIRLTHKSGGTSGDMNAP